MTYFSKQTYLNLFLLVFEQNLTSEVIMAHDFLPNHVSIKYASDCKDGEMLSDRGRCANVAIGQKVSNFRPKTYFTQVHENKLK